MKCRWGNGKRVGRESIHACVFRFLTGKGQKQLAAAVYRTIAQEEALYQAPTGVGKAISTVFPTVKAVGENLGEKIFLSDGEQSKDRCRRSFSVLKAKGFAIKY